MSLQRYGLQPVRLLSPWDSPGKNTGVGCYALLQGIFLTQGSNLHLPVSPALQAGSSPLSHWGSTLSTIVLIISKVYFQAKESFLTR